MSFSPVFKCWLAFEADNRYRGLQGVTGDQGPQGTTGNTGPPGPCHAAGTDFGFESIGSRTDIPWEYGDDAGAHPTPNVAGGLTYNWQDRTSSYTGLQSGSVDFTGSAFQSALFYQQYIHVCPSVNYNFSVVSSIY